MRVGWGFDAHRFAPHGQVRLAGVVVDDVRGVAATSDGDVVAHAVCDALLGAGALGDLGEHFPSDDPRWDNADSMSMLADVLAMLTAEGLTVEFVDVTVVSESTRVAPYRQEVRQALAGVLGLAMNAVSVKATSTDGLGFLGRDEGVAAVAVAVLH